MNYSRAFTAVFEDKNWVSKILIAGLIGLIPVVGQIYLTGWMIEIIRRVKAGREDILPATHFTYFLTLGLKMVVVALIYSIPVLLVSGIVQLIFGSSANTDESIITVFFCGLGCVGGIIGMVLDIAVALLGTYGAIKLAETDQIKACLDFQDAYNCIKANISAFIIVTLLGIVSALIQSAGLIFICVGIIFTVPYGISVIAHLTGQLWDNLKPYNRNSKPNFRGSVKEADNDDIIEEAPFTMVQDIEKKAEEAAETYEDVIQDASYSDVKETVEDAVEEAAEAVEEKAESILDSAEKITEETADAVQEKAEDVLEVVEQAQESVSDILNDEEKPEEEKSDDTNNDLPSFE